MLTAHEGNVEAAFQVRHFSKYYSSLSDPSNPPQELNKAQLKPFLMRIWGQQGKENNNEAGDGGTAGEGEGSKLL